LVHIIAAKAVSFREILTPSYASYIDAVIENARGLAEAMAALGYRIVSGGTDNHLFLMDVYSKGITGKVAEKALEAAAITVNKNTIPFDPNPPMVASGIRVGTPAVTTRGMGKDEMAEIAALIARALESREDSGALSRLADEVAALASRFPLYSSRLAATRA
jgi:glycine hydroxymethyltransferase